MPAPTYYIQKSAEAQEFFDEAIEHLDDETIRGPSMLPGWSVAHVLSHVARNADSHMRRAAASIEGLMIDQYPGGFSGRAAEIDAGADRPAREVIDDVKSSGRALQQMWLEIPDEAWGNVTRDVSGRERALETLPVKRRQELYVHLIDLGIGPTYEDWPDDFVSERLAEMRGSLERRLAPGAVVPASLDPKVELCWLFGRLNRPDLPELASWE